MGTYLVLNLIVLAVIVLMVRKSLLRADKNMYVTTGILLVTTAIFDSIIVSLGIVAYDPNRILGLRIGSAPIEDFAYAIAAGLLVPIVWHTLGRRNRAETKTTH